MTAGMGVTDRVCYGFLPVAVIKTPSQRMQLRKERPMWLMADVPIAEETQDLSSSRNPEK